MGKMLLIFVLLFINVSAVQGTEVKKENACILLSNSLIMFSSLTIISVMLILIISIIMHTKKVLIIVAYKLHDLCTTCRPTSCATLKLKFLDILLQIYVQVFQQFLTDKVHLNNVIPNYVSFMKF